MKKYEVVTKNVSWKALFLRFFSENSTKAIFAQYEGHKNSEEVLRFIRKHKLEAISHVMTVEIYCRKGQNQLKKML